MRPSATLPSLCVILALTACSVAPARQGTDPHAVTDTQKVNMAAGLAKVNSRKKQKRRSPKVPQRPTKQTKQCPVVDMTLCGAGCPVEDLCMMSGINLWSGQPAYSCQPKSYCQ